MDSIGDAFARCGLAVGVATVVLISALAAPPLIRAEVSPSQDPVGATKVVDKVEVKAEPRPKNANKVVIKREAIVPAQIIGPVGANVDAMAQQFVQQFRPILRVELRLMTSAADPTPAQRREIAIEGGKAVKDASKKMAEIQLGVNRVRGNALVDPRQTVRQALLEAVVARLPADQADRYRKEIDARIQDQRRAVMLNVVANVDKLLILSSEQRDQIGELLLANWDEQNFPTIETVVMYDAYFPNIPAKPLNAILDDEQKKIWATASKIQYGSVRNFGFINNNAIHNVNPRATIESDDEDVKAALLDDKAVDEASSPKPAPPSEPRR